MRFIFLVIAFIFTFNSCSKVPNPFKSNTFVVHQGYLSIGKINQNIAKQLPLKESVGSNKIEISSVTVYGNSKSNKLLVEVEFVFTSFQIPEGLPAIARLSGGLEYEPSTKEFRFKQLSVDGIKFLKDELVEYITKPQRKFIPDAIALKLSDLVLHKSKKEFHHIKSYQIKESKIKVIFK